MRTPGLRLRQVFEHTTSFKVKKPSGQTITIAKKGLSPSTVGRLRRFAQGGEVRGYDNGGEVSDPLQASFEAAQAEVEVTQQAADTATANAQRYAEEQAAMQPVQAAPRRVVAAGAAQGTMDEDARRRMDFDRMRETPATPAQPTIIINNTPAPTAQPQAMTAAPAIEQPASVEVPAKRAAASVPVEEVPLPPSGIAPEASAVPVVVPPPEVPTTPYEPGYERRLLGRDLVPPAPLAPTLTPATLTAMATPAAPVAPVASAAPTATPALPVAPEATKPTKPLTAQTLVDALKDVRRSKPNATVADAVTSLLGTDASFAPIELQEAAKIPAIDLLKGGKLGDAYVAGVAQEVNSAVLKGKAEVDEANIRLSALKEEEVRRAERAVANKQRAEELRSHANTLMTEAKASDDLKSFFGSQSAGYNVMSIIALAFGGFASGYTKTENYVLKAFNDASNRNLEEQKKRRDSKWSRYKDALGSADAADLLVKADNDLLASVALEKATLRQNVTKIQPQIEALQAQLTQKAAMNMAALDLKLAQAEDEREKAPPKIVVGRGGGAAGKKTGAEIKHEEWEKGRVFGIGGIPVKASGATGMKDVRDNLSSRNYAVGALDEALHDIESLKPGESINVLSPARQKALVNMALQIENFPQAFGYKRAVSKVAKEQLKEALADPLKLTSFFKELLGDVPISTGIRQLRDDAVSARSEFVKGQAQADSRREQDAAEYGLWKQRAKELKRFNAPTPLRPKIQFSYEELERLPDEPVAATAAAPGAPTPAARSATTPALLTREELLRRGKKVGKI